MLFKEVKVSYKPREIIDFLKGLGKSSFIMFDLKEPCQGDFSIAAWILHDLTVSGVLESDHDVEYVNNIPHRSFHFSNIENLENLLTEREATFMRPVQKGGK